MRNALGSSHYAAYVPVSWLLAGSVALTLAGCGGSNPAGAAAPAGAGGAISTAATDGTTGEPADAGVAGPPGAPATTPAPDDSPAAAAGTVTAYFTEINTASRAGQVADVSAFALPGCQACAQDVAVTRDLQQRGLRAAADPYALAAVTAGARVGVAITVTFTTTTIAVGLLDPTGRQASELSGYPTRSARAQLTLTGGGWLIQTILYATRPQ